MERFRTLIINMKMEALVLFITVVNDLTSFMASRSRNENNLEATNVSSTGGEIYNKLGGGGEQIRTLSEEESEGRRLQELEHNWRHV
jgi:hypothetical protein